MPRAIGRIAAGAFRGVSQRAHLIFGRTWRTTLKRAGVRSICQLSLPQTTRQPGTRQLSNKARPCWPLPVFRSCLHSNRSVTCRRRSSSKCRAERTQCPLGVGLDTAHFGRSSPDVVLRSNGYSLGGLCREPIAIRSESELYRGEFHTCSKSRYCSRCRPC
jgi:hypothetical protein